jgi:hypothetical protein
MRARLARRAEWHLTEHFFRAMFDFGILTPTGADSFKHMLLGAIGGWVAGGFVMTRVYSGKYKALRAGSAELFHRAVIGDDLVLVGLPMLIVAFVTLIISSSLFPDERDVRILGPLPVSKTTIFAGKLTAVALFTALFIAITHVALLPLVVLTSIDPFRDGSLLVGILIRVSVWLLTSVMASAFAMLAVTAIVGSFVLVLSRTRLHELTGLVRSGLIALLVVCLPLVLRLTRVGPALASGEPWVRVLPPAWFVALQHVVRGTAPHVGTDHASFVSFVSFMSLAWIAVAALGVAAAIVAMIYTVLFRHVERLMRPAVAINKAGTRWLPTLPALPALGVTPAFRAVRAFTLLTFRRSPLHQGVIVGLTACGVGLVVNSLIDGELGRATLFPPFTLLFVCSVAARSALALPMDHRANWIFRMTEDDAARAAQMRAVERVVTTFVVGVPVLITTPLLWLAFGPSSVIAALLVAVIGCVVVHAVLRDWRRIPFTCSYLPGKKFVASNVVLASVALTAFPLFGGVLLLVSMRDARLATAVVVILSIVAYVLHRRRLAAWDHAPLMFEDELPDRPLELQLDQ